MSLQSIAKFNPEYYQESVKNDLISRPVLIAKTDEEIGTVDDVIVDESGHFRYLVIKAGTWLSSRKFLLPIGRCRAYDGAKSIALMGIEDKQELANLPPYESDDIDYDYEENVRGVYRQALAMEDSTPSYERESYSYDNEPELYQVSTQDTQPLKLYEERLIADKQRRLAGEVTIGKRVETETAVVEVPVEKERVVIERNEVAGEGIPVAPGEATFEEGAVAKVKVYEETADIEKQAFVREEVTVTKEVEQDVVKASETLRKEEIEVEKAGNPEIE